MPAKDKVRFSLEAIFTVLLFGCQTILHAGVFISVMVIPLLPYLVYAPGYLQGNPRVLLDEIWIMFFYNSFVLGQIVFWIGLTIFLVAALQWLLNHHKKVGLFKTGLYSKLRHPQFTGIITITLGLTLIVLINENYNFVGPFISGIHVSVVPMIGLWFLQVLGYIAIARFEDRRLSRKYGSEFQEYRSKVPALFPLKSPIRIPEMLFTILIVICICLILLVLPYGVIRVYSHTHLPQIPFPWIA
jgi:protein-S-isoprenylcysteine O-methyltransferase Ste14